MKRYITLILLLLVLVSCSSIKKKLTVEIGIDPSWYPLSAEGQEKNIVAFSIELLSEIAKNENLEVSIQTMNWNNLIWGLQKNRYQAVLSTLTPLSSNLKVYAFSHPFLLTGPVLVVPKNSSIESVSDLKGKQIAVEKGSLAALYLQSIPGVILKGFDEPTKVLNALENEQVDAAALKILLAQKYIPNLYSNIFKIVGHPFDEEGLRLITLHDEAPDLIKRFEDGLQALKASGEYTKLIEKWNLDHMGILKLK